MTIYRNKKIIVAAALLVFAFFAALASFALGKRDSGSGKAEQEKSQTPPASTLKSVELEGRIRLVGSMPFPDLIITDDDGNDWLIPREEAGKFFDLQQQRIKVSALYETSDIILADGKKVGTRRILHNIKIRQ